MGKIIQLSDSLSNLIAAGEVVENMASVVKELVENSIDAESTQIRVDLLDTGLNEIKVVDNGTGMSKEDMKMSFSRHATSKIRTAHDLYHVSSLGFRGEAIPSIASVSHIEMISSEGETGYRLYVKNGKVEEEGSYAPRKGTSIAVRNLFYNTPARLKHLKSTNTELSYIVDYMNKIALSHPEIAFTLTNDKKVLLQTPGTNELLKVLSNIYSLEIIKNMEYFEGENQYFKIFGFLTKPQFTRSSKNHITLIANNRMIKNSKIIKAVREGYNTYLPIGKYPIVLLKIELDPLLIDVNIHPQKLEVKFTESRSLHRLITNTINAYVRRLNLIPEITQKKKEEPYKFEKLNLSSEVEKPPLVKEDFINYLDKKTKEEPAEARVATEQKRVQKVPTMEYIGTFMGTYLICQNDEGLFIIDQHAAAERIRYENYYKKMSEVELAVTELLIPITLDLSNTEVLALTDQLDKTKPLGITLVPNNYNGVDITHVPSYFPTGFERIYTEEVVKYILEGQDVSIGNVRDDIAKSLSCKHSIKANKYINRNEIDVLLYDLEQCENPYTCPHGRPVIIKFTQTEIEKMFKRIM